MIGPGQTDHPRPRLKWVPAGPTWARRLAHQVSPSVSLRDCCWHHSVDWQTASTIAVRLARQLRREHVADEEQTCDRILDLIHEACVPEPEKEAVTMLLFPGCGIQLDQLFGRWRLHHTDGRKRTYAMLESGVWRTVISR